jgi:hypothetical protein
MRTIGFKEAGPTIIVLWYPGSECWLPMGLGKRRFVATHSLEVRSLTTTTDPFSIEVGH